MSSPRDRRALLAALTLGGVAGALDCARRSWLATNSRRPGPPVYWLADREGQRIVGLDRHLIAVRGWRAPRVQDLVVSRGVSGMRDGVSEAMLWSMHRSNPKQVPCVARWSGSGERPAHFLLEESRSRASMAATPEALYVLESGLPGPTRGRLRRFTRQGASDTLAAPAQARYLAASRAEVLVGDASGEFRLFAMRRTADGTVRPVLVELASLPSKLAGLAATTAPGDAVWVAFDAGSERRVLILDRELSVRVSIRVEVASVRLAASPSLVWVADRERAGLLRISLDTMHARRCPLPLREGAQALVATPDGVLLATSGAVLDIDTAGRVRSTQGGFRGIAALASAPVLG